MEKRDWILLAVAAGDDSPVEPLQLHKALFLLGQQEEVGPDFFDFRPDDYGPMSGSVYRNVELLVGDGLVTVEPSVSATGRRYPTYRLTDAGARAAAAVRARCAPSTTRALEGIMRWAMALTFGALVEAVYDRFPHYRLNSVYEYRGDATPSAAMKAKIDRQLGDAALLSAAQQGFEEIEQGQGVSLAELQQHLRDG